MTTNSLKNFSLAEIEACIAQALAEKVGCNVQVNIRTFEDIAQSTGSQLASGPVWTVQLSLSAQQVPPERAGVDVLGF